MVTARAAIATPPPAQNSASKSQPGNLTVTFRGVGDLGFVYVLGVSAALPVLYSDLTGPNWENFQSSDRLSATHDSGSGTWDVTLNLNGWSFAAYTVGNHLWICELEVVGPPAPTDPIAAAAGPFVIVA